MANVSPLAVWHFLGRAWSVIGPLVGVLIGAWLARSWQRKQWVLDGKKAEYRELLSILSESYHCMAKYWNDFTPMVGGIGHPFTERRERSLAAGTAGHRVIEDRVFIDKQMREADILQKWSILESARDNKFQLGVRWSELHDLLVKMAHRDLGIK